MRYFFSKVTVCSWHEEESLALLKKLSSLYYKYGWAVKAAKVISVLNDFRLLSACHVSDGVVSEIKFPGEISKNIKLHFLKFEPHIHKSLFHSIGYLYFFSIQARQP